MATARPWVVPPVRLLIRALGLCVSLVVVGLYWRGDVPLPVGGTSVKAFVPTLHHPLVELAKLVAAFLLGRAITSIHRNTTDDHLFSASLEQAQVLLCVSGALMMIIIGDSIARAFGIAGAASIVRFRTPVEDPRDTIILFLSLGIGMACGLGAFAVAGLGTAFLIIGMIYLASTVPVSMRRLFVSLSTPRSPLPLKTIQDLFDRHQIGYEMRGVVREGDRVTMRYAIQVHPSISLDDLSGELQQAGVESVTWEKSRKI
jgi:hypothetical protein